jgi:predicted AlkP superfamily pyrophosphatase or phosphodiesterase
VAPTLPKKLVLVVIDGLTPSLLERAVESGRSPTLRLLAEHGRYGNAISTFPTLTPVCMSSLATGAHADVHGIPHLVWYHRAEGRFVEYGSSLGAVLVAGTRRSLADTIFNMNEEHLSAGCVTLFEALEDAGYATAAVNVTCYRGRTAHRPTLPGLSRAAYGPRRFFYYSLFESDRTGAPLAVRRRSAGSIDEYAAAVGRWLVARDGFDFFLLYLSDLDYVSHAYGPESEEALAVLERSDRAVGGLLAQAGGLDAFLERYAVILLADHGQTRVTETARLEDQFADLEVLRPGRRSPADVAVAASNRAGMVYRLPGCREEPRALAERLDGAPAVDAVLFLEDGEPVVRRNGVDVPLADLDYASAEERIRAALANPNAGDVLVSAAADYEFCDLAGGHHVGGGSHGSLLAGDSTVPVIGVGVGVAGLPTSIVDVAPLAMRHFGVEPPAYARGLPRAA